MFLIGVARLEAKASQASLAFLWDHSIADRILFPAAAMLEVVVASQSALLGTFNTVRSQLREITIPVPLMLPASPAKQLEMAVMIDVRSGHFALQSGPRAAHLQGFVQQQHSVPLHHTAQQTDAEKLGMDLFDLHLKRSALASAFATIMQGRELQPDSYRVHPAVLDNCTQVSHSLQHLVNCLELQFSALQACWWIWHFPLGIFSS